MDNTVKINGKEVKIKGIKKATGDINSAKYGIMYFDMSDGEVWTNVYADNNSWTEYASESIIRVVSASHQGYGDTSRIYMRDVPGLIQNAIDEALYYY